MNFAGITYGQLPRSYGPKFDPYPPRVVGIHKTGNTRGNALDEADWATRRTDGTSAHLYTDPYRIIGSVPAEMQAHSAHRHGNAIAWHIEDCGAAGAAPTNNLVRATALLCKLGAIPIRKLTPEQLRAGAHGIAGHHDFVLAFSEGTHTDPIWSDDQWEAFIRAVAREEGNSIMGVQISSAHVQQALKDAGFLAGTKVDGDWGRNSQASLTSAFKAAHDGGHGLPAELEFVAKGTLTPVEPATT